ncbi:protein of unknown function [Actinokineospora alba]|uniref:DUF397 domain-containing protein n=1 Tax=Actinokineospora alba TaxID=504798 RepID=A0A1H0T2B7_9PSEU|nr:DUF397 domain-containing protein [Actinokineospora alba]TDP66402.1 uncharacterized protein DUF397 [Actinokineospora alba]SDJ24196.1 protein of unknown function [Actinokineospora alba]SDP48193.1 protein of unknown function [Actinokineospora alba]
MHAEWRKSSFSGAGQADYVEIAYSATVRVRDSKNPTGGTLRFPASAWDPARLTCSEWPNPVRPTAIA